MSDINAASSIEGQVAAASTQAAGAITSAVVAGIAAAGTAIGEGLASDATTAVKSEVVAIDADAHAEAKSLFARIREKLSNLESEASADIHAELAKLGALVKFD